MTLMDKLRKLFHPADDEHGELVPILEPWDEERERRLTRQADALEELANALREEDDGAR